MLTKFTNIEGILEVKQSPERIRFNYGQKPGDSLSKFAALSDMKDDDGYLYVRCRAISSRVNKNNDGWPSEELMHAHETFIGRPVFVDHNNDDPKRTRGVIVDANCYVDDDEKISKLDPYYSIAPENHKPPTWIELLIEVDAETFPRLAKEIRTGGIDAVSMGANIEKSICSVCANEASTPNEYCDHIKKKGITFEVVADNGEKIRKKAYEDCYGVNFFEISFVFDPADTTALISEKVGKTAAEGVGVPIGLLDDAWLAIHPHAGEAAVVRALDSGDIDQATMIASQLSSTPTLKGRINPWYQREPEEIIQGIRQNVQYGLLAKRALTNPIDFFVEPVGAEQGSQDDPNYTPQSDLITAPQKVDTLRSETRCPICHAADMTTDPDGVQRCPVCGHVQEPEPLNNPDLDTARDTDLRQDTTEDTDTQGNPEVPVSDGTEGIEIAPMNPVSPVAARNQVNTNVGISDMDDLFTTQAIETTLGGPYGVHRGTVQALRGVANVKISFPTVEGEENYIVVPRDNPIFAFFLAQESASKLGVKLNEVPIVVEKLGDEGDLHRAVEIIRTAAATHPTQTKKKPILNTNATPSDEPKGEKIVADELAPREASEVTIDSISIGDKKYKVVPLDEEDDEKTPEEVVDEIVDAEKDKKDDDKESKTADRRHIVRSEQNADGVVRSEEIVEETDKTEVPQEEEQLDQPQTEEQELKQQPQYTEHTFASAEDEKEAKLFAAMKIADAAVEMGLIDKSLKMVYIAQLEEKSTETLETVEDTLALVKSAGLSKTKTTLSGVHRVPRLAHSTSPNHKLNGSGATDLGTDPEFLLGV